jgi:hypothetical protein
MGDMGFSDWPGRGRDSELCILWTLDRVAVGAFARSSHTAQFAQRRLRSLIDDIAMF